MRALHVVLLVGVSGALGFALAQKHPAAVEAAKATPPASAVIAQPENAEDPGSSLEGEALEVIDVPNYTYVRIGEQGSDGTWAAVSSASIAKGSRVRIGSATRMVDFRSEKLGRTFAEIYFGALESGTGSIPANTASHGSSQASSAVPVGKVDKASGANAFRVAEIYAQKEKLRGKSVRVRGVVVKSTSGVLGKTFLHLRDGSGDAKSANDDITVTSSSTAEVGKTIVVEGNVTLDKDFGAGYQYGLIIEDARVSE